jgi:hypothetical protein
MDFFLSRRTFLGGLGVAGVMLASPLIESCSSTGQRSSTQHPVTGSSTRHPVIGETRSAAQKIGTPAETQIDGKPAEFSLLTPGQFTKLTRQQLASLAVSRQPIGIEFNPAYSIDAVQLASQFLTYKDAKGRDLLAIFGIAALHTGEKIMLIIPIPASTSGKSNTAADIASYSIDPSGTKFVAVGVLQPAPPDAKHLVQLFNSGRPLGQDRIKYGDINPNTVMFVVVSAYQVGG